MGHIMFQAQGLRQMPAAQLEELGLLARNYSMRYRQGKKRQEARGLSCFLGGESPQVRVTPRRVSMAST